MIQLQQLAYRRTITIPRAKNHDPRPLPTSDRSPLLRHLKKPLKCINPNFRGGASSPTRKEGRKDRHNRRGGKERERRNRPEEGKTTKRHGKRAGRASAADAKERAPSSSPPPPPPPPPLTDNDAHSAAKPPHPQKRSL